MMALSYSNSNIAAVVEGNKSIRLENRKLPELQDNHVIIAIEAVGICGSDLKYWAYGRCGRFSLDGMAMVIGHEASGVVQEIGPEVKHLKRGDRVAIEPGVPCKNCDLCSIGRYNLCKEMKFCATPPVDGNLCKFYTHDADFCHKLPDSMSAEEGAMLEPLSVAVHTCRRASIQSGHNVAVFGAGPIGILCGLVAKERGASKVLIIDIDENRLEVARKLCAADLTYHAKSSDDNPVRLADELRQHAGNDGFHAALECSGADISLKTAMQVTRAGGSVLLVGRGSMEVSLPMVRAGSYEIDVKGIFRYANTYPEAIRLVATGAIDVTRLITHRFVLERSNEAFIAASDPRTRAIKIMISCQ